MERHQWTPRTYPPFVCEGRVCYVVGPDRRSKEPRLLNAPLSDRSELRDIPEIALGERFQIDGLPGEFRTRRAAEGAAVLTIERVA
jgi:hypothetical protein